MKIPTLTSKKHKILTHNNIDYYLFYHPVLNCIKNILSISDISQNFTLRFENFKYKGEKAYSEQYTGNWWKNTEASLPYGSNLLSIILYSDATTTDTLGKSSLHPIYISIGNISTKRHNKSDAKQLLGYLPILKAKDKSEKKSKDFKKLVRLIFHNSMKFLLNPLFAEKGIDLEVDNKTFWFFPHISTIICDWPEATENKKLSEVYAKWNKMYMMSRSEIFTESDLENFQFGIINGYTTETYESLHKDFVKIPYRMSNKKNMEDQIMKTLKRQDIINVINKKQKKKKPIKLLNFSSKLFETKLTEANIYFCEKMNDPNINDNMIKGFNQFLECFDDFLDNILEVKNIKECDIIIYAISMDSSDYQSDEGLCYGKILLMAKIEIEEKPPLNLTLVQWYDFKFEKNSYLYNCPLLKLVELYNLIPIETIDNIVHITSGNFNRQKFTQIFTSKISANF
ncbi:hypothetical protein Glove_645g20 [Diversispora epigaea]|uniref:Uncharacterized protein n=1 Tax=Diversispora epigaea TaxID=1348612 RepID=A0A397GCR7_9GLOM|nr:hypothetical protein Glove_645g20 [Diversispora epigaea]